MAASPFQLTEYRVRHLHSTLTGTCNPTTLLKASWAVPTVSYSLKDDTLLCELSYAVDGLDQEDATVWRGSCTLVYVYTVTQPVTEEQVATFAGNTVPPLAWNMLRVIFMETTAYMGAPPLIIDQFTASPQ